MSVDLLELYLELRRVSDCLYDVQDVRIRTAHRLRGLPKEVYGVYPRSLLDIEKQLTKQLNTLLKQVPVWNYWLKDVKGVGPRLAGAILSRIAVKYQVVEKLDNVTEIQRRFAVKFQNKPGYLIPVYRGIQAFPNVSKLWAYCGLHVEDGVAPRRRRGERVDWNPTLKMLLLGRLATSFIRTARGEKYEQIYRKQKSYYMSPEKYGPALQDPRKCPRYEECIKRLRQAAKRLGRMEKHPPCRAHIDAMARRYMIKEFVKDLWIEWRKAENLPIFPPYWEARKELKPMM